MALPRVGFYITNAVLCFAYGKDVAIVDTNVIRGFQRVFTFQSKKRRPKIIWNRGISYRAVFLLEGQKSLIQR